MCSNIRMRKNAKKKKNPRRNILLNINVDFSFGPIPIS